MTTFPPISQVLALVLPHIERRCERNGLKLGTLQSRHQRIGVIVPIGSMYAIYANIWGILMVNVTIYSIHGSYGYGILIILIAWAYCSQFAFGGCASLPQATDAFPECARCHRCHRRSSLSKPRNQRMVFVIDMLRRRFQSLPIPNNPNRVLHATWPLPVWFEPAATVQHPLCHLAGLASSKQW